jgi:hypothetical protein
MTAPLDNDTTYDGHEDENNTYAPVTGERYVIFVRETSGTATISPDRGVRKSLQSPQGDRQESRLPQTVSSAGRQARARVRNHAVTNSLGACITLTYREVSDNPARDLTKFIRDVRRFYPEPMQWVSVTEGDSEDSEHRLHHHVMLPLCRSMHKVASQWPHGDIHVGLNLSDSSIRCAANYLTKTFFREFGDLPRYRISRGRRTVRTVHSASSLQEAESVVFSYLPRHVRTYVSNSPGIAGRTTFYWEPHLPVEFD